MASRTQNAKRNIISGLIKRSVSMLLPFIVRTVLIQQLGSLYLGLNGLFSSILQVLSLAELGFGEAMVFSMYEPISCNDTKTVRALLRLYKKIYNIIGAVVLAVGICLMPFLPKMINGDVPAGINIYVLFGIYLINTSASYFLFAYKSSLLVADQRSDINSNITTICNFIMYILQILLLYTTKNYYIYCITIPALTVCTNVITELLTRKKYPQYYCDGKLEKSQIKDIEKRVAGLFIYKVCAVFRNSFDSIIISAYLGLVVLAKYQNYYYIMNSIMAFMLVLTSSITAGVGNSIISESKEKNLNDFNKFQFIYMGITCVCTACFYCLFQPFMKIWVGEDLMFTQLEMVMFCVYFFTSEMGNICYVYRQAAGLWWQDKFRPVVEAVTNLILNVVLVRVIGVTGVLLATILCLIFINCLWGSRILFKHYFDSKENVKYLLRILLFAISAFAGCKLSGLICAYIGTAGLMALVLDAIIAIVVSSVAFCLIGLVLPEHRSAFAFLKRMVIRH